MDSYEDISKNSSVCDSNKTSLLSCLHAFFLPCLSTLKWTMTKDFLWNSQFVMIFLKNGTCSLLYHGVKSHFVKMKQNSYMVMYIFSHVFTTNEIWKISKSESHQSCSTCEIDEEICWAKFLSQESFWLFMTKEAREIVYLFRINHQAVAECPYSIEINVSGKFDWK